MEARKFVESVLMHHLEFLAFIHFHPQNCSDVSCSAMFCKYSSRIDIPGKFKRRLFFAVFVVYIGTFLNQKFDQMYIPELYGVR